MHAEVGRRRFGDVGIDGIILKWCQRNSVSGFEKFSTGQERIPVPGCCEHLGLRRALIDQLVEYQLPKEV
jgi:hypothetical protein